jgi:hypothetical protein
MLAYKSIISGMKSFLIILVMAVLVTSTFGNQIYAKHAHSVSSNSTGGSSSSHGRSSLSSSNGFGPITTRGSNNNITSFVEDCFTNKTASVLNITVNNASEIIEHCFYQYKLRHINKVTHHHPTATSNPSGLGTLLAPGQLIVTSVKHPPMKHSAAYNIGYKLGVADGKRGGVGLPNGSGVCSPGTRVNGTDDTNQCLAGYFAAWNKYCPTSKYGCNS